MRFFFVDRTEEGEEVVVDDGFGVEGREGGLMLSSSLSSMSGVRSVVLVALRFDGVVVRDRDLAGDGDDGEDVVELSNRALRRIGPAVSDGGLILAVGSFA